MEYTLFADTLKLSVILTDDRSKCMLRLHDRGGENCIEIPIQSTSYLRLLRKAVTEALDHHYNAPEGK
jgi:hypothetical protein